MSACDHKIRANSVFYECAKCEWRAPLEYCSRCGEPIYLDQDVVEVFTLQFPFDDPNNKKHSGWAHVYACEAAE